VENENRLITVTSSVQQLLQLLFDAMNFDWRPDAVYASLQSHEWFLQDCAWSGWNRTHWHRCNPVCGCNQMTLEDIVYLLPHHLRIPPRGYVIEFPINSNLRNPHRLRCFTRPQSNSLSNIAGAVVQQQLQHFFYVQITLSGITAISSMPKRC